MIPLAIRSTAGYWRSDLADAGRMTLRGLWRGASGWACWQAAAPVNPCQARLQCPSRVPEQGEAVVRFSSGTSRSGDTGGACRGTVDHGMTILFSIRGGGVMKALVYNGPRSPKSSSPQPPDYRSPETRQGRPGIWRYGDSGRPVPRRTGRWAGLPARLR